MTAEIFEIDEYKNRAHVFTKRLDAGERLSEMLAERYKPSDKLWVMAIPMGGVPVALAVKDRFQSDFELLIVRKLQIPGNTEAGFGAMSMEGDVYLNSILVDHLGLSDRQIEVQKGQVKQMLDMRNRQLRQDRPFPDLQGRTAVLVDDGLATGYTMLAAVRMVKNKRAGKIVVAVPTAPTRSIELLEKEVEEIYCANIRDTARFAVAEAYKNWRDLADQEVIKMLDL